MATIHIYEHGNNLYIYNPEAIFLDRESGEIFIYTSHYMYKMRVKDYDEEIDYRTLSYTFQNIKEKKTFVFEVDFFIVILNGNSIGTQ